MAIDFNKYGTPTGEAVKKVEKSGYFNNVWNQYKKAGQNIISGINEGAEQMRPGLTGISLNPIENAKKNLQFLSGAKTSALRTVGGIAQASIAPITEAPGIKQGIEEIGTGITKIPGATSTITKISDWASRNPEAAKDLQNIVDITTLGLGKTVEKPLQLAAIDVGEKTLSGAGSATSKITKVLATPKPTPLKAAGQILQGATKDIKSGVKGLAQIDTTGIKTFQELGGKIKTKISELVDVVDKDLALDNTKKVLDDLVVKAKTTSGKVVKYNPVKTALNQLDELYTKIGDVVKSADIKELIQTAKNVGLTNLDVNNIARVYGQEFSEKAFNKVGDALTSVNAQMYENTRKALKSVARSGIKGDAAKIADEAMSNLYRTQTLIKKNIEAVNKIQQKIAERGLLEKVGNAVSKYSDILTGGSLRGIIGGLLPRGAGYKVMNALDIEGALSQNLKILQDAIKSKSDDEIIKILKGIKDKTPLKKTNPAVGKTADLSSSIQQAKASGQSLKYKTTVNIQDKNDLDYLRRIFSDDTVADIKAGKKTNWRGENYSDIAKVNIISETPKTVAQQLEGKIKNLKLKSDTFYHGTSADSADSIMSSSFKIGSQLPENTFRGGGYGKMQNSISFAETPKEASIFSELTKGGKIIEVKLKPNSKVVSIYGIEDAIDLEDYISYLKKQKIDAVYIGGGEKELVVINPKAVTPTRSQLKAEWDKATPLKKSTPLNKR